MILCRTNAYAVYGSIIDNYYCLPSVGQAPDISQLKVVWIG